MKSAKTTEELIQKYVSKEDDTSMTYHLNEFIDDARPLIEKEGRIHELQRMSEYHQYMANLVEDEMEKNIHLANITVIQQRIHYLENKDD